MSSKPYRITLRVGVSAPFITQSSEPGAFGLDAVVARDDNGKPIIPGSLLIGKLLDAWKQFGETQLIARWLGNEAWNFEPSPGRLCDADLRIVESKHPKAIRTPYSRVEIGKDAGAGVLGALLFIEQPWAAGEIVCFKGMWHAIGSEEEVRALCGAIKGGLMWMAQLGAERSIGFGRVASVEVASDPAPSAQNSLSDETASRLYFALTFTEPLCLPETATDNLFVSSDIIPGNVMKAAFALTWGAQEGKWNQPVTNGSSVQHKGLAEHFSHICFSHAFPAGNDKEASDIRPLPLPQSLVLADKKFYDVALLDKPYLIDKQAPAFQIDWKNKDYNAAGVHQAWGETRRALRVRTAIEEGRRISKEEALFAYQTVSPAQHTRWLGWVDFSAMTDIAKRNAAMQSFITLTQSGLHYVGKTKAVGMLTVMPKQDCVWTSATAAEDGAWIVMLNTPALLTPISELNEASGKHELGAVYADYWKDVSKSALKLCHYFARQRLAGGKYAYERRQRKKLGQYRPWLLTEPGSVFILRAASDAGATTAKGFIDEWMQSGLPLGDAVKKEYTGDWQHNPYLPENGYGEISVNIKHPFIRLNVDDEQLLTTVEELTV